MNDRNNILVSVVMCTYNGGRFIKEQLLSVLNQSYSKFELIISDDASTDDTVSQIRQLTDGDARVKIFVNELNKGYTENFNSACSHASGDVIAFCDQDDVWHPQKIETMMKAWNERTSLIYCDSVRFTDQVPWDAHKNHKYRRFEGTDGRKLSIFNTISGHAMLVKSTFLKKILPFPKNVSYDWYAGVAAAYDGGVQLVDKILVFQRVHGSNVTVGGKYDHNDRKHKHEFNQLVLDHNEHFVKFAKAGSHQDYFSTLIRLWKEMMNKKFSLPLFLFLLNNRNAVFNYKKRKISLVSHIKHSYKLASNS